MSDEHYLKQELDALVCREPAVFEFIHSCCLDGLWYWDLENPENEWMSPRFWELLGYDPALRKPLSSEWQGIINPADLRQARENFEKHCADPTQPYDLVLRFSHKNSSTVWVRCRGIAIRDSNGKPIRMLGVHTDVTALKRAEEDIRRLASELAASQKELETFSYSVSHDLRAPLRAVDGFSRMVEGDYAGQLDAEGRRMLGIIRGEVGRMGNLLDALLVFSRLSRQPLEPVPVDMHALAQEVFDGLAALEPERKLRFVLSPLPTAIGTLTMIRQVWVNLIGNAIKFTQGREPGEIEIGARDGEEGAPVYYVKDNGVGFDMRFADKLFGIFQRFHRAEEFPGIGVGLALVQHIVHRHGGRVWAEAEVNRGTTVYFTLASRIAIEPSR
jgi:PAS domain S-box-containing protein